MSGININRLQWLLSGVVSASLALAPALVAQTQQGATSGQQGNWGQAGPPPDAQNGQIPPPDSAQDPNQNAAQSTDQGPPQYPGQQQDQGGNQAPSQYPGQQPGQQPAQQSNQAPGNNPAVGYGQPPRPAYQSGQNQNYGQPNGYQGNQGQQRQAPMPPPSGPVTMNAGMLLPIRTSEPLDSKKVKPGDYFQGTVAQGVYVGNVLAIPQGAQVTGRVVDVKKAGELKGGASIALQLTNLNLGGNSYALATDVFSTSSFGKGGYTASNTVGAAALGAVIGAVAGGGPGAAIGAVAGTGVGLGASAATPGPRSVVPPEALLTFHLTTAATVQPVSYQEASQLATNEDQPARHYQRPPYGYGPGAYPAPYAAYGAPYPYAYGYSYAYVYGPYGYGRPYYYRRWR